MGTRHIARTTTTTNHPNINNETIVGHLASNDMDTMADTCCAGVNWALVETTGDVSEVNPFKDGYEATKNIPIATCAMLISTEYGSDIILIGHKILYFGNQMQRSLLKSKSDPESHLTPWRDYSRQLHPQ